MAIRPQRMLSWATYLVDRDVIGSDTEIIPPRGAVRVTQLKRKRT
jgi:hypothetical protein